MNEKPMRVIICGGRDFDDYRRLCFVMSAHHVGTVVHGGARGADDLAHQWVQDSGAEEEVFAADWQAYGKAAGPIRNQKMADSGADMVIAFWDGKSRGTLDMITRAAKAGIPIAIYSIGLVETQEQRRKRLRRMPYFLWKKQRKEEAKNIFRGCCTPAKKDL